jgi:hypothetical protein
MRSVNASAAQLDWASRVRVDSCRLWRVPAWSSRNRQIVCVVAPIKPCGQPLAEQPSRTKL